MNTPEISLEFKPIVAIIGAGNVGSHIAAACLLKNLPAHILLCDSDEDFEAAQVMDLKDSRMFCKKTKIEGGNLGEKKMSDADIFVITAGVRQEPGEDRCSLLARNVQVLQGIKEKIGTIKPSALIILVTNPVDVLTEMAVHIFDLPRTQVFGTGTLLDSARLRWRLAERFDRHIDDVDGFVIGEHGDSEVVAWSSVSLSHRLSLKEKEQMSSEIKNAAYSIIQGKGSTYFGIGAVTAQLLSFILSDSKKIIPLSCSLQGEYGVEGIALGVPVKIGRKGIEKIYELEIDAFEKEGFLKSAEKLKSLFLECQRK